MLFLCNKYNLQLLSRDKKCRPKFCKKIKKGKKEGEKREKRKKGKEEKRGKKKEPKARLCNREGMLLATRNAGEHVTLVKFWMV